MSAHYRVEKDQGMKCVLHSYITILLQTSPIVSVLLAHLLMMNGQAHICRKCAHVCDHNLNLNLKLFKAQINFSQYNLSTKHAKI